MWEGTGVGVQWGNLNELASPDDNWTFLDLNLMLLADGVLYLLIALYIEGVWPGEFGEWKFILLLDFHMHSRGFQNKKNKINGRIHDNITKYSWYLAN